MGCGGGGAKVWGGQQTGRETGMEAGCVGSSPHTFIRASGLAPSGRLSGPAKRASQAGRPGGPTNWADEVGRPIVRHSVKNPVPPPARHAHTWVAPA
eukprot:360184-Chlamydomonas_euryale.AAC.11